MNPRESGSIDKHIGARLRAARIERGLSQAAFGEKLGLSFQQVQKYELGKNRISAGRLLECADILVKPVDWFFEGLARETKCAGQPAPDLFAMMLANATGRRLVEAYLSVGIRERAAILAVADALAIDAGPRLQAAE